MKVSWAGGVLVGLLTIALPTFSNEVTVFLSGESIAPLHVFWDENGRLLVPLEAFGLRAGVEVTKLEAEGLVRLRRGEERALLPRDDLTDYEGSLYICLETFIDLIGGAVYRIGDDIHIEIDSHALISLDITTDHLTARFDAYLPYETILAEPGNVHLRFHQCTFSSAAEPTTFSDPEGPVTTAIVSAASLNAVDFILKSSQQLVPRIKQLSSPGFYSVTITFGHQPLSETQMEILPDFSYHKIETDVGKGPVTIEVLHVKNWRHQYRLRPALPEGGVGTLSSAQAMLESYSAEIAVGANPFDAETSLPVGLLVIDDTILSFADVPRAALAVDLYGRLTFFQPTAASFHLRSAERFIPVDDVNRPIRSDELIAYTENYHGTIAHGTTRPFRIIKLRADRVVSIQNTPYVIEDPSATLLVASGEARARLSELTIGDEAVFDYTLTPDVPLLTDLVSTGPLLIASGEDVLDTRPSDPIVADEAVGHTVLATDWYGGLFLIAIAKDQDSVGASYEDILTILHDQPTRIKDAIPLASGTFSTLSFRKEASYRDTTYPADIAVGLLLIPIER
jgi:hypothetical protein